MIIDLQKIILEEQRFERCVKRTPESKVKDFTSFTKNLPTLKADGDHRLPQYNKRRSPLALKAEKHENFHPFLTYSPKSQFLTQNSVSWFHNSYTYITKHSIPYYIINFIKFIKNSCTIDKPSRIETKGIIHIQSKYLTSTITPSLCSPLEGQNPTLTLGFPVLSSNNGFLHFLPFGLLLLPLSLSLRFPSSLFCFYDRQKTLNSIPLLTLYTLKSLLPILPFLIKIN